MARHDMTGGAQASPLDTALAVIPMLPRPLLERFVADAIDRLDDMTPDCDLEEDDPSGQCDEDGINTGTGRGRPWELSGPGCPIGDGGY